MRHYDESDRAFRRAEQAWLSPPEHEECEKCGEPARDGAALCDDCALAASASLLPDDIATCTPEHVRAESARCRRLRDAGDDDIAVSAERALAWYVLRAIAAEGHPLARAATEVP